MNTKNDMLRLEQEFKNCQKALVAIGDGGDIYYVV